jgi:hypothetical protein
VARTPDEGVKHERTFDHKADAREWMRKLGLKAILDDMLEDQLAKGAKPR